MKTLWVRRKSLRKVSVGQGGKQEGVSEAKSIKHRYMHTWNIPSPRYQQYPAPVAALPTQTKGTGKETSCRLTVWTNPAPDEVRISVPGFSQAAMTTQ
jgi:hypothetical protein